MVLLKNTEPENVNLSSSKLLTRYLIRILFCDRIMRVSPTS